MAACLLPPDAHVAIVGGGFAGALLAVNIVRFGGPRVTLIERSPERLGRGLAYGAARPEQLLNVRAGGMSAFPDDPEHFTRWLRRHERDAPPFVRRRLYGLYLRELLEAAAAGSDGRLELRTAEARELRPDGAGWSLALPDETLKADAVVLASGNLPSPLPARLSRDALLAGTYVADPWAAALRVKPGGHVLLIGTGLTAIDVTLELIAGGAGTITMLSRRGLLPRAHDPAQPPVNPVREAPEGGLADLLRHTRRQAEMVGWRGAVDALRPVTQTLWARADEGTRRRFLRHLRAWWDVHRHRIAPNVATQLEALRDEGRLQVIAGALVAFAAREERAIARFRRRGQTQVEELEADLVVNCTGVGGDLRATHDPLLVAALAQGLIRPDPLRLGIDCDAQGRVVGADGQVRDNLLCLGPLTRGALWETTAVPDIRRQAWTLGRRLANAHWVEGEGL